MKIFKKLFKKEKKKEKKEPIILKDIELIKFGEKNIDGVIYEKDNLGEIYDLIKKSEQKCLFGQLDHPKDGLTSFWNVSHSVENINITDTEVKGDIRIFNDILIVGGQQLISLLDSGITLEFAPRSFGIIKDDGTIDIKR
jgi:hypothetical protein